MTEELKCPICGKPTVLVYGKYPRKDRMCKDHSIMVLNKEIEQCEACNKWYKVGEKCECAKKASQKLLKEADEITQQNENASPIIVINEANKSKCITCGKHTEGLLFCGNCYRKYKDKELLFRITNCSNVELLDEDYEGRYTCQDGHIVKSKSERDIDNYLFRTGIQHAYEKKLPYGANSNEVLHPDFYLPHYLGKDKHVYIEHWGYNENNIHYTKTKKFKMPIYKQLGITLICTHEKTDAGDIDAVLERKLNKSFIREGEINFDD